MSQLQLYSYHMAIVACIQPASDLQHTSQHTCVYASMCTHRSAATGLVCSAESLISTRVGPATTLELLRALPSPLSPHLHTHAELPHRA